VDRLNELSSYLCVLGDLTPFGDQDMHWELLTTQAVLCVRAGAHVQGE
jgi:hypothetical protein